MFYPRSPHPLRHVLAMACVAAVSAACSAEDGEEADAGSVDDVPVVTDTGEGSDTGLGFDTSALDISGGEDAGAQPADTAGPDDISGSDDAGGGEDAGAGSSGPCPAGGESPGECGWPCLSGDDCFSGICVPTPGDNVCTLLCELDACPDGWVCAQVAQPPDSIFACVPKSPNLGKPCEDDVDCVALVGAGLVGLDNKCVDLGDEGAFCGADCSQTKCPAGFTCKTVKTTSGETAKQCVADNVNSGCTERYVFEGYATACNVSNEFGSCGGQRTCAAVGLLAPCDADAPAEEVCNGVDDDCDGATDEPAPGATCEIKVGNLSCPGTPLCVGGQPTCLGTPPAPEACNGIDDDCDGETDEGCDDDQDGFCDAQLAVVPGTPICPNGGGDCNDDQALIQPGATEVCDGVDNDCNGLKDALDPALAINDVQTCEKQDGVCSGATKPVQRCQNGAWQPCTEQDYKQHTPFYQTTEICDDKDNDCDGAPDAGCDDDGDDYCDAAFPTQGFPLACPKGGGDCKDDDAAVNPGQAEACNDLDDDCDLGVDEGCDDDKDGYCDASLVLVGNPAVCASGGGDCDDEDNGRSPGETELCNDVDDDCDAETDEDFGAIGGVCSPGAGSCAIKGVTMCAADGKSAVCSASLADGGPEICDGVDNNCDGSIDEGCDDDNDDYCDASMAVLGKPTVCPKGAGDCDDTNPAVLPGAKEVCNGLDDDCDAKADGADGDLAFDDPQPCALTEGVCSGIKKSPSLCVGGQWQACTPADYAAWNPNYGPVEVCDNLDNDCNGSTDEICDKDKDGYCVLGATIQGAPTICSKGIGDCNDNDGTINPGAIEACDNKDNDCNSNTDEACDGDGDDYCDISRLTIGKPQVCPNGGGDCQDGNPNINPGADETCADFVDNNCSGQVDELCGSALPGFGGVLGPTFVSEGLLQCAGYYDKAGGDDIPLAWGGDCTGSQWNRLRIVCGASPQSYRYIDVNKNVFKDGLGAAKQQFGLISNANFDLQGNNLIKSDGTNPNLARSWWVSSLGCSESLPNLIVGSEGSCGWEAANCFGQNISGPRYLYVYVGQ